LQFVLQQSSTLLIGMNNTTITKGELVRFIKRSFKRSQPIWMLIWDCLT